MRSRGGVYPLLVACMAIRTPAIPRISTLDGYPLMSPKHQRLTLLTFSLCLLGLAVTAGTIALQENIVYFHTPSELSSSNVGSFVRVGGLVETGSVRRAPSAQMQFNITDGDRTIPVRFTGIVPDMFTEGQGVIAEGIWTAGSQLEAERVLAKHDENYMPTEVAEKLRQSGMWRESSDGVQP